LNTLDILAPELRENWLYRSVTSDVFYIPAGEQFAQRAQCWYAQRYVDPNTPNWLRPAYFVGGVLSSLWVPGNSDITLQVLSTALGVARVAASTGPTIGGPRAPRGGNFPAPNTPRCCFVAGTEILTADGEKSIEDIRVGDYVISDDPTTPGEIEKRRVLTTFERETSGIVDLYVDGEVISTTSDHPFWVPGQGWVEAKDLKVGTRLQTDEEAIVDVDKIEHREGTFKVYNFEVEGFHTYFVSGLGILVHNNNCNINPQDIRFTQPTVSPNFSDGGTITDAVRAIRSGRTNVNDFPTIRVVERNGNLYSMDNRRLATFNAAGVDSIPVQVVDLSTDPTLARQFRNRFNPINGEGQQVVVVPSSGRAEVMRELTRNGLIRPR
jgi:hypothetical protein